MPYVVRNAVGQYLYRKSNAPGVYSNTKRRVWVESLDQATIWEKAGHAKSAANQARSMKPTGIQEVRLMLWGNPIPIAPKRIR